MSAFLLTIAYMEANAVQDYLQAHQLAQGDKFLDFFFRFKLKFCISFFPEVNVSS